MSAREALHHDWFRTAPDTHNAQAHENIIRRVTREDSCSTTVTQFPNSNAPSRATVLRPTMPSFHSTSNYSQRTTLCVAALADEDTLDSEMTRSISNQSTLSCYSAANAPFDPNVTLLSRLSTQRESDEVDGKSRDSDEVEGKVFRITRGGLQQAAWGDDSDQAQRTLGGHSVASMRRSSQTQLRTSTA